MNTKCPNYKKDTGKPAWCTAYQWNLEKGFTYDPCTKCIKNPLNIMLVK